MQDSLKEFISANFARIELQEHKNGQTILEAECQPGDLVEFCRCLFCDQHMYYAMLVVEESAEQWIIKHVFYAPSGEMLHVLVRLPLAQTILPSIATQVHAADWHEREAEDLFGLTFEGHPRLGDFVLHDHWPEGTNPMRSSFDASQSLPPGKQASDWQPIRLLESEGSFAMPIGPIYSDVSESALFVLETVGEDVLRTIPRLFYKHRGIEKLAEGQKAHDVLLLAERFSGTASFAHTLAFCRAMETIGQIQIPARAQSIRLFVAELERVRHHVSALAKLCASTALAVAASQASILEEQMLRLSCKLSGHRFLFGMNTIGGLSMDIPEELFRQVLQESQEVGGRLLRLRRKLTRTSSFLDRLQDVGVISQQDARAHAMLGPAARACGISMDLRQALPYGPYGDASSLHIPTEQEGDGYARMRIFFEEIQVSLQLMKDALETMPKGPVAAENADCGAGAALGWSEAPGGGTFHWVRTDEEGKVLRWRLGTPSFANWHGFHLAAEKFAFQDFPIILASMGLSVAESDR